MDDSALIPGFTDAPSQAESAKLTEMGRELYNLDRELERLEKEVEKTKQRRHVLATKEMPDYMQNIGQDRIGLPEFGVDLIVDDFFHAVIQAEWPPEKREAAFKWLEDNGHGDLIKTIVTIAFPRRALPAARWLIDKVKSLKHKSFTVPEPSVEMTVPWNTLTAFVKEQYKKGVALPLDTLGATVGRVVKVKGRK